VKLQNDLHDNAEHNIRAGPGLMRGAANTSRLETW
jgi:hypothetical protein